MENEVQSERDSSSARHILLILLFYPIILYFDAIFSWSSPHLTTL